ncbi:Methyl-accepting chemotaxis protein signailling domain-containing protein, Cyclic nucleotide-binding domain-containing protein [Desulfonema limicola]|uniref:Methyl-accepting chemotaxis protein signailling domain-containing protein, Cyclic nucleotide-binding domain-containing protein n=1 Tax=Desulfonema limicola TaxID=45656 RepID=A0A975BBM6_9BACT|nr:methyl-accepting chemotaxis protein [Desulfonema limicola]QTA82432.1 Methyl-accepting chemotaxis protein signailling domain-containing protein, Cyclic nucleotide-binding domain-containing protein [Desulfonema limicola]
MLSDQLNKKTIPCAAFFLLFAVMAAVTLLWYTSRVSDNLKSIQNNASGIIKQLTGLNEHLQTCMNNNQAVNNSLSSRVKLLDQLEKNIKTPDLSALDSVYKIKKQDLLFQNIIQKNKELIDSCLEQLSLIQNQIDNKFIKISDNTKGSILIISIIFTILFFMIFFSILFGSTKRNKPLRHAINGLAESTEHVTKASLNVSSVSQMVADRTSEQAKLLEDILSNLKDIAAMTNQNSEDVNHADTLMKNIRISTQETTLFMDAFAGFMEKITSASEESSRIVQSIDDVAFQTNILALNAAIEAARVGNAGEGFAVVADEVRSLSRQVTKASGEISDLLKGISLKITEGMKKFNKTNNIFHEVADNVLEITLIVNKVAKVSAEQTSRIEGAYNFINKIKDIALQNVKESDRSASASVEMSAQAEQLKGFVDEVKFVALREGHYDKSMHSIVKKELSKGDYLIRQGEYSQEAYIIEEGEFDIFLNENPEKIVATLKEGDIVGEIALIKNVKRTANVVAKSPARVVVLYKKDCMDVLGKQKVLSRSVANMIKRRLEELR